LSRYLAVFAGAIFCSLGFLHALFTLLDMRRPRRLVPENRDVMTAMASTGVRLSRGGTNMWDAWLGFNLSHALGAMLFGAVCITAAMPTWILVVIAAIYEVLALRFWFRVPAIGIGVAGVCLLIATLV
jgi:hypothetical protein